MEDIGAEKVGNFVYRAGAKKSHHCLDVLQAVEQFLGVIDSIVEDLVLCIKS
jgi:hypothetical protein